MLSKVEEITLAPDEEPSWLLLSPQGLVPCTHGEHELFADISYLGSPWRLIPSWELEEEEHHR